MICEFRKKIVRNCTTEFACNFKNHMFKSIHKSSYMLHKEFSDFSEYMDLSVNFHADQLTKEYYKSQWTMFDVTQGDFDE